MRQTHIPDGQWRLAEIQVANWGTFDGAIYRVPVSRKGHLITGPSGSGKSSLLDAVSAVLTPDQWLRFNTAAQGSPNRDDRRTPMSYVRGAWSRATDELDDRVVSRLLRARATWSGILLRYENGKDRPVSLCRLFFAKGTGTQSADLSSISLIERSALDLRDLEPYAQKGLETRKIQTQWPDALVTPAGSHRTFYARMRKIFSIANESALQLLHKTQSAKSLDSLDQLFRDYMLDRPLTFDIADNAALQFGELNDAHEHVVELRLQRDHLLAFRDRAEAYAAAEAAARSAQELAEAVLAYQRGRRLDLARAELSRGDERTTELGALVESARAESERRQEALDVAKQRELQLGGGNIEHLRRRITTAREESERTHSRWGAMEQDLRRVDIAHAPENAAEYAELIAQFDEHASRTAPGASYEQQERLADARRRVERAGREIATLQNSGSSIPAELQEVRDQVAAAIGAATQALPFAAELIEVQPRYADWTGAIERVLRPLALTMLVPERHLAEVRRWVNAHRIRGRLDYEVVGDPSPARPAANAVSLLNRLTIAEHPYAEWLAGTLSARFDYACVDGPDDFDRHERAITIEGQIKRSSTRYQKDDSRMVGDRRHWILGDRESKHEALIEHLHEAEAEFERARLAVENADAARQRIIMRNTVIGLYRERPWADVDREGAAAVVSELENHLDDLTRADGDLNTAILATTEAEKRLAAARVAFDDLRVERSQLERERAGLMAEIDELESNRTTPLADAIVAELDRRFSGVQRRVTRQSIGDIGQQVANTLRREKDDASRASADAGGDVVKLATQFNERWPAAAAELLPTLADRAGYLELLDGIAAHRLPDHENRFLRLLRERSRDMVGDLVSEILDAPDQIKERIQPINASLKQSLFDRDRFLRLKVKTRRSAVVNELLADLRSVSSGSWNDADAGEAEARFATLAGIMRRFSSSDRQDQAWKRQCLDTRLHVTFLADEIDAEGRTQATYDSAASLSGGQQQKLVVFCLAAALRYQLADIDDEYTAYGTVVLDEAFDKADAPFTRMALDVFAEFGFHLVLATPHKLLQTLEPYIGGATEVENPTRRKSVISEVMWQEGSA